MSMGFIPPIRVFALKPIKLKEIGYDEMLELTSSGSKALHYRAVELAGVYNMPILVASSFNDSPGYIDSRRRIYGSTK